MRWLKLYFRYLGWFVLIAVLAILVVLAAYGAIMAVLAVAAHSVLVAFALAGMFAAMTCAALATANTWQVSKRL